AMASSLSTKPYLSVCADIGRILMMLMGTGVVHRRHSAPRRYGPSPPSRRSEVRYLTHCGAPMDASRGSAREGVPSMEKAYGRPHETLDQRFYGNIKDMRLEMIADGCRWAKGAVYVPAGRYLLWSDIPNDRILRWDAATGVTGVFREPAGYAGGH